MQKLLLPIKQLSRKGRGVGFFQKTPASPLTRVDVVGAIPGDEVWAHFSSKRRRCHSAILESVVTPSVHRTPLRCVHAPQCGGCSIQSMAYPAQLREKEQMIHALFEPFVDPSVIESIIPCDDPWQYRNKMEFSFSQNRAGDRFLGLILADSQGKVVDLSECHLVNPWLLEVLQSVRHWWAESGLLAYRMNDTGSLRTLTMREGIRTGDKMVILTVSGNPDYALKQAHLQTFIQAVTRALPIESHARLSLFLRIHQLQKGEPTQFYEMHLKGPDHLMEALEIDRRLLFKISPTSFFQPNTRQAEKLYQAVVEWGKGAETVYDLYAGTATLGLALAGSARQVISIELNPHAVFDAKSNQEINGIENIEIIRGDVGQVLEAYSDQPDLVIVDPPRTGLDRAAMTHILRLKPKKIIYVSCNPVTQADNIKEWVQSGYHVERLLPIDQFPHTIHVENIAFLRQAN